MRRFKNILFISLSEQGSQAALRRTHRLAATNDAALTVLGAVPEPSRVARLLRRSTSPQPELLAEQLRQQITSEIKKLRPPRPVEVAVGIGVPFLVVIERVLTAGHDLLVITDDGPDSPTASTTKHLLRKCPCPVWVMRPSRARRQRILAAIDPLPDAAPASLNNLILDLATAQADQSGGELRIAHAWTLYGEHEMRSSPHLNVSAQELDELLEATKSEHRRHLDRVLASQGIASGGVTHVHLAKGQPGEVIPDLVAKHRSTLLVIGTVGRTKVPGLIMGTSAERILDRVRCSVLAVKPEGFVSPVANPRTVDCDAGAQQPR